ncbi:MAG: tetratricopeptide repeat protein, partial [Planctomycetota bacterium]
LAAAALAVLLLAACDSTPRADSRQDERTLVRSGRGTSSERAAEVRVAEATALKDQGIDERALAEFERAIEENPDLTVAYMGAADIYRERGDYTSAERRYREATELEPRNFEAQYYLGLCLQLLDRAAEAVRVYLTALALRPDDFDANLNLATAYIQLDEPAQARPYAERAVRIRPDDGPARVNLGAVYADLEEHGSAVVEYRQAAELMELSPELLLNLAESLGRTGRYAEMSATLEQAVRIEPSPIAYERLGSALFRLKDYDASLDAFRDAAELDAGHYPAWNGVGVCLLNRYLWSERRDESALRGALEALRRSLQIRPNQPKIVELLRRYG